MKILITGHKGFIGQNLTFYLQDHYELSGYEWQPDFLPEVEGFDWVIHLGAISATTVHKLANGRTIVFLMTSQENT